MLCPFTPSPLQHCWHSSAVGLDEHSVLDGRRPGAIAERMRALSAKPHQVWFAERFIDGREFNLSILAGPGGPEVLPPAEIVFEGYGDGKPRVVGYRAKWDQGSFEYTHTVRRFDFPAGDAPLLGRLRELSLACHRLFGLRGWARVDFRVDGEGNPFILEVNVNPCISPDAGFAAAVARSGLTYEDAIARILADVV